MANISEAYGYMTIKAATLDEIETILELHDRGQEGVCYDIMITLSDLDEPIDRAVFNEETSQYELELDFTGNGRWNFINNVEQFIPTILKMDDEDELSNVSFQAEFNFKDAEPGCNFIYEATILVGYDAKSGKVYKQTLSESDEVDYTASNLIEYGFYNSWEVLDTDYILKHFGDAKDQLRFIDKDNTRPIIKSFLSNISTFKEYVETVKKMNAVPQVFFDFGDWLDVAFENVFPDIELIVA